MKEDLADRELLLDDVVSVDLDALEDDLALSLVDGAAARQWQSSGLIPRTCCAGGNAERARSQ